MPAISASNLTLLRTSQHKTLLALSVYHPPEIWRARTSGAQSEGAAAITVNAGTVVQTRTPYKHAQVLISSVGYGLRDLGETYFKSFSSPTLNVGSHNSTLPNGAYITVTDWIPPTAIHPTLSASDVVSEDGNVAYTNENLNYMPLARMGCPAVAYIDPATGLATVKFYSSSVAIAAGATLSTYAWSFRGGTPATSASAGTAGAPVTVTWNAAGEYYCFLTVTDSNGKTHTRRAPVFIYDAPGGATQPYTQLEIDKMDGDVERGWSSHIKVHGAATETEFPNQALCVISARDWYGDTETSIGGGYVWRENIVLTGYVRTGTTKKNSEYGYVEFDLESSPIDNLEGLAATLTTTTGTPSGWHELKNMTLNLAAHHILTQHSTLSEIADIHLDLLTYAKSAIDLPESSVRDQLSMAAATPGRGRVVMSAQGMLYLESDPQLLPTASRATYANIFANSPAPNAASIAFADLRNEIDLGTERAEKQVAQVDLAAEDAAAAAIYSLAPAKPWRTGRGERTSGIRAADQAEANVIAGLIEGKRNNDFADVVLPLRGNYRIVDTAPAEQVQITLTAAQNKRGITWANQRCWPKRISYEYRQSGIFLASLVVEKDAVPSTGITGNYPATPPDWPAPTYPPVETPIVPPAPGPGDMIGKGNLLYVTTHKGLAKCEGAYGTNGTDGVPVWTAMNGSGGGALGNVVIRWFNLDPFSVSGDHFTAGWAMTDAGLYRVTGLPTTPVWTLQLSVAAAAALIGQAEADTTLCWEFSPSVRRAGFIMCAAFYFNGGTLKNNIYTLYSYDYGATWSCTTADYMISSLAGSSIQAYLMPSASFHLDNTYYISGFVDWRGDQTYSEANYGNPPVVVLRAPGAGGFAFPKITPATSINTGVAEGHRHYNPYCDASGNIYANDDHIYLWRAGSGTAAIRRMVSAFTPIWSVGYTPPTLENIGHASMPTDISWLFSNMFDESNAVAIDPLNLWFTPDLNAATPTWTRYNAPNVAGRTLTPRYLFCVPIDSNIVFFTGSASGAGYSLPCFTYDFGSNFVDISQTGTGGALDTVMGLTADSDMNDSIVMVDYFKA